MRFCRLLPALLIVAAASPVLASPATSESARQLEQSYADYLTRAVIDKGVVSVTPDGDDYVVAWDLEKGIVLLGANPGALKAARFSYRLTPSGDGAWRLAADGFPTLSVDAPTDAGRMTGTFELRGFGLQGAYDPAQTDFLRAKLGVDVAHAKFKVVDAQQTADSDAAETGVIGEMRAKTAADGAGVDVASVHSIASLTETIVGASADGSGPTALTYSIGAGVGEATLTGLRAKRDRGVLEIRGRARRRGADPARIRRQAARSAAVVDEFEAGRQAQRRRDEGPVWPSEGEVDRRDDRP
jgi:hypothetical protein